MSADPKEALKAYRRAYYLANRQKTIERSAAWYAANKAKVVERGRERRRANAAEISAKRRAKRAADGSAERAAAKAWRDANPERLRARKKREYAKTRERQLRKAKEWAEANRERSNEIKKRYKRSDRAKAARRTPRAVINNRMANMVWRAMRGTKCGRSWQALVGYSHEELQRHIERQFVKGMSWDNATLWHIDHIIPLASFTYDSEDDPQFKRAWALSNLRPLWALENQSKNSKILTLL